MSDVTQTTSRDDARERGMLRFFTGKPCKRGHFAERWVSSGGCAECACENAERYRRNGPDRYLPAPEKPPPKRKLHAALPRLQSIRRAARARRSGGKITPLDVDRIFEAQRGKCAYCRCRLDSAEMHRDHITPLARNGSSWPRNIQLTCSSCNTKKGAKDPIIFAQTTGRLL